MPLRRVASALCHWRHLTVIAPSANIAQTGKSATMTATQLQQCAIFARKLPGQVFDYSNGMCHMQQTVYTYTPTITTVDPTPFSTEYFVSTAIFKTLMASVGIRTDQYDSASMFVPSYPWDAVANGLTFGMNNCGYSFNVVADQADYATNLDNMANMPLHEWQHSVAFFYGGFEGYDVPSSHDLEANYTHFDGTPLPYDSGQESQLRAVLSGDLKSNATGLRAGCTSTVWSHGPPRKAQPL